LARQPQPGVVHWVEAAQQGQHVVAAQAVVARRDHHVPERGRQAWVEDLHRARAGIAREPGRQRALAAASDRQRRRLPPERLGERAAEGLAAARAPPRRGPGPGGPRAQQPLARLQAERTRQRAGLADVAGAAVAERPATAGGARGAFHGCDPALHPVGGVPSRDTLHWTSSRERPGAATGRTMADPQAAAGTGREPLDAVALDRLFRQARTYNAFGGEVGDDTIHRLYELVKLGPTQANSCPARFVFVKTPEG